MAAQSTSFASAINMSQWKSNDMPQNSWLNGGSRWNMDSNVNDEPNNQSSDWGAKGGPNGLSLMDQKKTNGWPAISSANSNGLKPGDVIPGDVNGMNGTSSGSSLLSSDQNQGQRNGNFAGESSLTGSIWGSGSSEWGGIQTSAGSDKPETAPSFNQGLQGVRGMQSTNSGNPWGQGPAKSPLTSESNISLSSAPSSSGATFTTSSASSNSNTHWSGNNSQGQGESPQERENSPLAKPEVSEESNFPNSSTATSTTSSVSTASDTSTVTEDSNKPTNNSNAQNQQGNMAGKNSWEEDGTAWNSQSRASQGMEPGNGSGGWGSATPTSTGPSGWGTSTSGEVSGWGALPSGNQGDKNATTGWGHTDKVEDQETLGTEIWGSKSDASVTPSAWGKPLGAQTTGPTNQWGTKPNSAPNQQSQGGRGWGPFPSAGNGGQSGWNEASVAAKLQPTAWGDANSQVLRSGVKDEGLAGNGTQWGKMPINQGTKWDIDSDSKGSKQDVDNGTAVWSGQHQNPPRPPPNAWNKDPPKSPWGNPVQQSKPPQPDSAWGAPPNSNKAWGNPDEPKQAWGQPQQSQWNQSGNSDNRSGTSSAWGGSAPPTAKPPSSRTGPSNNNYGSWNKDDNEGKKQQSFPQENQTQSVSPCAGWLPILDIPQEIVPTGWGQLSPSDPSKPFGLDDGTYVWGDSKEHNAWVTEMSAKNVLRMKQLKQKAAAAATAGGTSTMQSPSVPSSKPPSTPSSEDGAPVGFSSSDQKKTGWDETGSANTTSASRPKTETESGGEWQNLPRTPSEESKWGNDSQHSSSWGTSTRSSAQSREPMQTWNEESTNISSSIGHWGEEEWDRGSQNSDASSGVGRRKLSVSDTNGNRNPSQVALKLRALMDRGFSKEDAEMMLKKHNMNLESAFEELAPGQDHLKTTSDMDLQFSNMKLHGCGGSGDMSSNFSMNMMQNMRNKGMNNLGAVGGPGYHGQGPQNQRMPQQKFQGQMSSGNNQPLRGNFNPMQQQQQQQQQQLLQAMAAGMNQNSQLPQQLIHALQQNPQLLAQLQNMQGGNSGKPGYMNRQSDFFRNQFMPQNQAGQSRPRAPFSNNRPMMQGDADMNNPNFLSGAGFGQDMGGHQPQQSRMEQFFSKQQRQQQQQQQQQNRVFSRHPGNLPKPMRSDENNSRSTSPAASDSMPNSADSAFSDSSVWPFSQPSVDDQGDGVPEFKPGVPWKPRTFDVANDPDATPGSVGSLSSTLSLGKTPGREREKHDDLNGILMRPMKPPHGGNGHQVWGHGNRRSQSTSGGWNYQESGSVFQRQQSLPGFGSRPNRPGPPPGLENNPRNSNWNRAGSWDAGSWSGNDGMSGGSNWLVLRNVGNVDSSYLHILCRQHGVVEQFNLNQAQGMALVAYKNREDAMKARQALNSPSFGISANFVNPNEIGALVGGGTTGGSQWSNGQNKLWDDGGMHSNQSQWNGSGLGGVGLPGMQGSLWSPGPMAGGNGGIGSWGGSDMPVTPNLPLLPEDLLN